MTRRFFRRKRPEILKEIERELNDLNGGASQVERCAAALRIEALIENSDIPKENKKVIDGVKQKVGVLLEGYQDSFEIENIRDSESIKNREG